MACPNANSVGVQVFPTARYLLSKVIKSAPRKNLKIRFLHEHYPAEGDTGENLITHNAEEVGVVVLSRMELTIDDRVQILETGDGFYIDAGIPHRFRNIDSVDCDVVTAATPPNF
jgi:mannose-6-phosphate isomerase-like protein (cupin superfamily)